MGLESLHAVIHDLTNGALDTLPGRMMLVFSGLSSRAFRLYNTVQSMAH